MKEPKWKNSREILIILCINLQIFCMVDFREKKIGICSIAAMSVLELIFILRKS